MPADFLDSYVTVSERIARWYVDNPDGRIVADPPTVVEIAGKTFIASTARAYRSPDDSAPCQGSAWEPYPGTTNFTRDSEAMNAESSAVGRALALAGIEVKRGMASREEVRNRQPAPPKPVDRITAHHHEALLARIHALPKDVQDAIKPLVKEGPKLSEMTADQTGEAEAFLDLIESEFMPDNGGVPS